VNHPRSTTPDSNPSDGNETQPPNRA
jgi:hypothetical protein